MLGDRQDRDVFRFRDTGFRFIVVGAMWAYCGMRLLPYMSLCELPPLGGTLLCCRGYGLDWQDTRL